MSACSSLLYGFIFLVLDGLLCLLAAWSHWFRFLLIPLKRVQKSEHPSYKVPQGSTCPGCGGLGANATPVQNQADKGFKGTQHTDGNVTNVLGH